MGELIGVAVLLLILWLGVKQFGSSKPAERPRTQTLQRVSSPPVTRAPTRPARATPPAKSPPVVIQPEIQRMIAGLPSRSLDELQRQWLNAVRIIERLGPDRAGAHIAFREALTAEWARRLQAAEANERAFPWPTTKAPKGKAGLDSGDWHLIGMLSYLGYRVGATNGEPDGVRRQILDVCFSSPLPPINGLDYMRQWGPPGSTTRLRKLANEIASFARNGKRKRSANLSTAVLHWEDDLEYLYRLYYVGKFRFTWPRLD